MRPRTRPPASSAEHGSGALLRRARKHRRVARKPNACTIWRGADGQQMVSQLGSTRIHTKPDSTSVGQRYTITDRHSNWSLDTICFRHLQGPTPPASEALGETGGAGGKFRVCGRLILNREQKTPHAYLPLPSSKIIHRRTVTGCSDEVSELLSNTAVSSTPLFSLRDIHIITGECDFLVLG